MSNPDPYPIGEVPGFTEAQRAYDNDDGIRDEPDDGPDPDEVRDGWYDAPYAGREEGGDA